MNDLYRWHQQSHLVYITIGGCERLGAPSTEIITILKDMIAAYFTKEYKFTSQQKYSFPLYAK